MVLLADEVGSSKGCWTRRAEWENKVEFVVPLDPFTLATWLVESRFAHPKKSADLHFNTKLLAHFPCKCDRCWLVEIDMPTGEEAMTMLLILTNEHPTLIHENAAGNDFDGCIGH